MSTYGIAKVSLADNLENISINGSIEGAFKPEIAIWNDLKASKNIFYCKVSRIEEDLAVKWVLKNRRLKDRIIINNSQFEFERSLKLPINFCKYRFSSAQLRINLPRIMRDEEGQRWWIQMNIKQVGVDHSPQTVDLEVNADEGYHSVRAINKKDLLLGPSGHLELKIRIIDHRN